MKPLLQLLFVISLLAAVSAQGVVDTCFSAFAVGSTSSDALYGKLTVSTLTSVETLCYTSCSSTNCPSVDDVAKAIGHVNASSSCNGKCCPYGYDLAHGSCTSTSSKGVCTRTTATGATGLRYTPLNNAAGEPDLTCAGAQTKAVAISVTCVGCAASGRGNRFASLLQTTKRSAISVYSVDSTARNTLKTLTASTGACISNLDCTAQSVVITSTPTPTAPIVFDLLDRTNFNYASLPAGNAAWWWSSNGQPTRGATRTPPTTSTPRAVADTMVIEGRGFDARTDRDHFKLVSPSLACSAAARPIGGVALRTGFGGTSAQIDAKKVQLAFSSGLAYAGSFRACYHSAVACSNKTTCKASATAREAETQVSGATYSETTTEGWYDLGVLTVTGTNPTAATVSSGTNCTQYFRLRFAASTAAQTPPTVADTAGCSSATTTAGWLNCFASYANFEWFNAQNYIRVYKWRAGGTVWGNGAVDVQLTRPTTGDASGCAAASSQILSRLPTSTSNSFSAIGISSIELISEPVVTATTGLTLANPTTITSTQTRAQQEAAIRQSIFSALNIADTGTTADDINIQSFSFDSSGNLQVQFSVEAPGGAVAVTTTTPAGQPVAAPVATVATVDTTTLTNAISSGAFATSLTSSTGGTVNCASGGAGCTTTNPVGLAAPSDSAPSWMIAIVVVFAVLFCLACIAAIVIFFVMSNKKSSQTAPANQQWSEDPNASANWKQQPDADQSWNEPQLQQPAEQNMHAAPNSSSSPAVSPSATSPFRPNPATDDNIDNWPPAVLVTF